MVKTKDSTKPDTRILESRLWVNQPIFVLSK